MSAPEPPPATIRWLRTIRLVAYGLAALLAVGTGAALWLRHDAGVEQRLGGMAVPPSVSIGGPFTLTDHTGAAVTEASYRGRLMLIFFGFTHCPDVCPTELQVIAEVLDALGEDAARVAPLFVTVDPERDTPEALTRYVALFDPRIIGLTGTPEQIAAVARAYRVYYAKVHPPGATEYTMDHSSFVYLMDAEGRFAGLFRHGAPAAEIAAAVRAQLRRPGA
ncbi:SCO family protein [Elioraea sp.]|uniref:SCO family protein n=1 Tax=Elioraea sp. TaxID=2185103 RepID=UPI0021DE352A|nr:SCO family protein [Elioraea sp.]GIX11444.1 MAG: copper-binding protein [Elioraea sp.]